MKKIVVGIVTIFILVLNSSPAFPQLKKIRFSTTSIAITELQFKIAQLKGFYGEDGLDLETLLIRGAMDCTKKGLTVTKEIPPGQVLNFSFAEKALGRIKN